MQTRFRIFMGATALLYLGPLLAGLGGADWPAVPAFAAVFVLWLVFMRPRQWPRSLAEWWTVPAITQGLTQAMMQLVLVTLLFVFGRAIGGALGLRPDWPGYLPLTLSFLAIPLGRLIWDPWKMAEIDGFLGHAIDAVENFGSGVGAEVSGENLQRADRMLAAMPQGLAPDEVGQHLSAMEAGVGPAALWRGLQMRGAAPQPPLSHLTALAVFATDGRLIADLADGLPNRALDLLPDDPGLISLYAARGAKALAKDASLWGEFPTGARLMERIDRLTGTAAESPLRALVTALDRCAPAE